MSSHNEGGGASRTTDYAAGTSAATDVSLLDHVTLMVRQLEAQMDRRMLAIEQQVRDALAAAEKVTVAERATVEERVRGVEMLAKVTQESAAEAVRKAEAATEKRFESVNEFRAQLADQTSAFLPREVFDTTVQQWSEWRQGVDKDRATLAGRSGGIGSSIGWIVAGAGFVATVLGIIAILASGGIGH